MNRPRLTDQAKIDLITVLCPQDERYFQIYEPPSPDSVDETSNWSDDDLDIHAGTDRHAPCLLCWEGYALCNENARNEINRATVFTHLHVGHPEDDPQEILAWICQSCARSDDPAITERTRMED